MSKTAAIIRHGKNELKTNRKHTKSQWTHRYALVSRMGNKLTSKNGKSSTILPGISAGVSTKTLNGIKKIIPDTVGTVDRAIRENNIFTALSKMPAEVQKILLVNGWIEKKPIEVGHSEYFNGYYKSNL